MSQKNIIVLEDQALIDWLKDSIKWLEGESSPKMISMKSCSFNGETMGTFRLENGDRYAFIYDFQPKNRRLMQLELTKTI